MKNKKVLVIGANGAMARYMIPYLAECGCKVDGLDRVSVESSNPNVRYITGDAKSPAFRNELLSCNYDAIVDFMIYSSQELPVILPTMLSCTGQYVFLSSGRIYDNLEVPVKESSPRLIDSSKDYLLVNSDDYCIRKARGENILCNMPTKNWTIVRPATTYSYLRYQLVTLEAADTVGRARAGKKVVLPIQAKDVSATLSWGGDAGKMIGKLLFNSQAMGETFNINSAEHHKWGEIADYYTDICKLQPVWVDKEDFLAIKSPDPFNVSNRWQLEYARLFERIVDNSKVLAATGMKQQEMMPLYDGLKYEIDRTPLDIEWKVNQRMDDYLADKGL